MYISPQVKKNSSGENNNHHSASQQDEQQEEVTVEDEDEEANFHSKYSSNIIQRESYEKQSAGTGLGKLMYTLYIHALYNIIIYCILYS